jgi:xylan 1,4-beta-xylosidase
MINIGLRVVSALFLTVFMAFGVRAAGVFEYVSYQGSDPVESAMPIGPGDYRNPILPGFHPDPSIVRVGEEYFLVNSSFGWLPGLPIYRSLDLVNWQQIGNAIDQSSSVDLKSVSINRGIFAPTIRYHNGLFYIITTCVDCGSNFIITARNPKGPWSKPVFLKEVDGIDPDIFFDDGGRVWITNNGPPAGQPAYDGHRALWIQEYDIAAQQLKGPRKVIVDKGVDPAAKPIWIEGPHIIKKNGYYYLIAAEGGTSSDHSQTVFRSQFVTGPYLAGPNNPILTQRDLDPKRPFPVTATGHADFVELPDGSWWSVFLGNRPYQGWLTNLGRETFLLPVDWRGQWPIILPKGQAVPQSVRRPWLRAVGRGTNWSSWRDDFNARTLGHAWIMRRGATDEWLNLKARQGALTLGGDGKTSFVGRRQQHAYATVETELRPSAHTTDERVGLAAIADEEHHYFFGRERGRLIVAVRDGKRDPAAGRILATSSLNANGSLRLRVIARGAACDFAYALGNGKWQTLITDADNRILATEHDGLLFTGTVIGPFVGSPSR